MTLPLKIAGDGPMRGEVQAATQCMKNVELLGHVSKDRISDLLRRRAHVVIVPSICDEGFPMVVVEAFAAGAPVIGQRYWCAWRGDRSWPDRIVRATW